MPQSLFTPIALPHGKWGPDVDVQIVFAVSWQSWLFRPDGRIGHSNQWHVRLKRGQHFFQILLQNWGLKLWEFYSNMQSLLLFSHLLTPLHQIKGKNKGNCYANHFLLSMGKGILLKSTLAHPKSIWLLSLLVRNKIFDSKWRRLDLKLILSRLNPVFWI